MPLFCMREPSIIERFAYTSVSSTDIRICNRTQLIAQEAVVKGHARLIVSWKGLEEGRGKEEEAQIFS
jgi:hypothetical protein